MADYSDILNNPDNQNWVKIALAVHITREGLLPVVKKTILQFQSSILKNIGRASADLPATCNSCETYHLLSCPTTGACSRATGRCKYHSAPPRPCPEGICNKFKAEIEANHRFRTPSWKNTDAKAWCTDSWQIAKCYMSPDGYSNVQSAEETDFNGIVNVFINCKRFDYLRGKERLFEEVNLDMLFCNLYTRVSLEFFVCLNICSFVLTS